DTSDRAAYSVQLGDLNNDGKLDVATANRDNTVSVLLRNGDGTMQAPANFETGPAPTVWSWSLAVVDLNPDGEPDLAAADRSSQQNFLDLIHFLAAVADRAFWPEPVDDRPGRKASLRRTRI